jgi:membrane-associated phospholipid phosphatase
VPARPRMSDSKRPLPSAPYHALLGVLRRRLDAGHAAAYVVGAMAAGAVVTTLVLLALAVTVGPATAGLDRAIMEWVGARRGAGGERAALQVTALGDTATLAVLLVWVAALLLATGRRLEAVVLSATFAGGRILNEGLKAMFGRARPEAFEWGVDVVSASFPSAHAMSSAIAYGALAYLVGWVGAGQAVRRASWIVASLLALGVAASRVYLGVHYPTDAIAGLMAGAVWTAIVLSALPAARQLERR